MTTKHSNWDIESITSSKENNKENKQQQQETNVNEDLYNFSSLCKTVLTGALVGALLVGVGLATLLTIYLKQQSNKITTTTLVSTTATTTTDTTTTTGCGSKCQTLLLSDSATATVQTLVNDLQSAGLTVNYISNQIASYTGSPDAATYGSIILITGSAYATDMPTSGQQSIVNARQNNGTGVVITEWAGYQVQNGRWSTLSSLLLATRITGASATMSLTLVNSGHPIWNGLATSFTSSVTFGYSTLSTPRSGSITVANCTSCGTSAVIVYPSSGSAGRIVQIAHAAHNGVFNYGNDANVETMMINAVKWAAQLI